MNLKEVITHKIFDAPLSEIQTENQCIINTFNPHSYIIAKKDKLFEEALLSSDVLLPDGIGIVLAAKFLKIKANKKNCRGRYTSIFIGTSQRKRASCLLYGSHRKYLATH